MAERSEAVEQQAVRDGSAAYVVEPEIAAGEGVPPGYKRTDVGVVPEDWEEVLLGDIAHIRSGGTPSTASREFWSGGIPWCTPTDITALSGRKYLLETERTISRKGLQASSAEVIPPKSIIMTTRATIGECAINMVAMTTNQGFKNLVPTEVAPEFLYYLMSTQKDRLIQLCGGSTFLEIGKKALKQFIVALPVGAEEQRAIATALSDADALIESLDRLIAKKRAIKQAAMQKLLTGQTRLPGFTDEWETKRLGDVGTFYKGQGIRRDDVSDEGVPCIRYGEIYTRYGDCVVTPESRIPVAVAETAFSLRCGDILFAGSGETVEEIGMCVAYLGEQPAFAGGDIVVLRPNEGVSAYLGRLLNHPTIAQEKARLGQGDAVVHISARNLAQIEVQLPRQEEQTAIATVLSDIDTEIEALERRRDKARQIKQGMMQQLLTGRVRLVGPESSKEATA